MGQFMEEHSYACTETSAEADREGRSNCQTIGKVVSSVSKDDDPSNRDNTVAESCTEWLMRTYVSGQYKNKSLSCLLYSL